MTLVLIALLACPWNIVLARAESSEIALDQESAASVEDGAGPTFQRLPRGWGWDRASCSLIAADFDRDEEEGDDDRPLTIAAVPPVWPDWHSPAGLVASLVALVAPMKRVRATELCHLRC